MLRAALALAKAGVAVVPLFEWKGDRCACAAGKDCGHAAKHPRVQGGWKSATRDEATIRDWWRSFPNAGIGVAPGKDSRIVVLDVDKKSGGFKSLRELTDQYGKFPPTHLVQTGGGGAHFWFNVPNGMEMPRACKPWSGIEFLSTGNIAVAPPTLHRSGQKYTTLRGDPTQLADIPQWLLDALSRKAREDVYLDATTDLSEIIPSGARNSELAKIGGWLRGRGAGPELIEEVLLAVNTRLCDPPLAEDEIVAIAQSMAGYDANFAPLSDLGNARRLVRVFGGRIRFNVSAQRWLIWDGTRWVGDEDGEIHRFAKTVPGMIKDHAAHVTDTDLAKAMRKWASKSESAGALSAMVRVAETEVGVPVVASDLDQDLHLFGCSNGLVDLRNGKLYPHNRDLLITNQSPVAYNPQAKCPLWGKFLSEILNGDKEYARFLQVALGYSLTGETSEQVMFLMHGTGQNGKSTFLEVVRHVMADYARQADFNSFMETRNDGPRNDLARLVGARFVVASEGKARGRLDEQVVKQLTGQDTVPARFLYKEFFEFRPTGKIWLSSNHRPEIMGTDLAIWRRIKLLPFTVTIPPEKKDDDLQAKLLAEGQGILAWMVRGAVAWYASRLPKFDLVDAATLAYRESQDIIGSFISDCCRLGGDQKCKAAEIYDAYKEWATNRRENPWSNRRFKEALSDRGVTQLPRKADGIWWSGIAIGRRSRE